MEEVAVRLKKHLIGLSEEGVKYILPRENPQMETHQDSQVISPMAHAFEQFTDHADHKSETLSAFSDEIKDCSRCAELANTRKQVVFGHGNPNAELMFVGEAPGADEDAQGVPFVGRAGQLLTKIIHSIGLDRKDVYIANVLKCRPPGNRNPHPDEIENCKGYLLRQIEIIAPKVICTLGTFSAQTLLNSKQGISSLRGQSLTFGNSILIPTFHPSYLLRSPNKKKEVWQDMILVKKALSN